MDDIGTKYNLKELGTRIKNIRELRKKTQLNVAEALNIRRQTLINWEAGDTIPSLEKLIELCKILDCNIDYLLGVVDLPDIEPISTASHYSGISTEIIRYGLKNPDYLDCLNFFMRPDNIADIFHSITQNEWKTFWINTAMQDIKGELKEKIIEYYNEYISITPYDKLKETSYKEFLKEKFPKETICLSVTQTDNNNNINIKKCISKNIYQDFLINGEFNYSKFISYLVKHTYKPLFDRTMLELQKNKLANMFVELITRYHNEE